MQATLKNCGLDHEWRIIAGQVFWNQLLMLKFKDSLLQQLCVGVAQ